VGRKVHSQYIVRYVRVTAKGDKGAGPRSLYVTEQHSSTRLQRRR
jgi:hypothetical protein